MNFSVGDLFAESLMQTTWIKFTNLVILGCVSLGKSESGYLIQDHSDDGVIHSW